MKSSTAADDLKVAEWVDIAEGHRKPLPPLEGNTIAEKVAALNARTPSPFAAPGGFRRFDNNG